MYRLTGCRSADLTEGWRLCLSYKSVVDNVAENRSEGFPYTLVVLRGSHAGLREQEACYAVIERERNGSH